MYAKILNVLKTAGLVVALVGVGVALTRPQIINVTVEFVTGVNSPALTSNSPPMERAVGAGVSVIGMIMVAVVVGLILYWSGWGRRLIVLIPAENRPVNIAILVATIMILGIFRYLFPGTLRFGVQVVIVVGVVVITILSGVGGQTGRKILAYAVGFALLGLLIHEVFFVENPWRRNPTTVYAARPAVVTASTSGTTTTLKAYEKTYEIPATGWSGWNQKVVPEYYDFSFLSTGPIDIETYRPLLAKSETGREYLMPKVFHDTPEITQPEFIVNTPLRSMWRFRSRSGKPESITFDLRPVVSVNCVPM